jgi:hypothetical protein
MEAVVAHTECTRRVEQGMAMQTPRASRWQRRPSRRRIVRVRMSGPHLLAIPTIARSAPLAARRRV